MVIINKEVKTITENQMVKIKDVLDINKGGRLAGDAMDSGSYPLYTCKATVQKSNFADYDGKYILIGSGGIFRIYRSDGKFSASSDVFVCKAKDNVSIVYLYHILRTKMDYFNSKGKGSTIKHLSKRLLEEELIPLPSYEVQLEIEKKLLAVEALIEDIDSNFQSFESIRKEILNRAFRGELTEQDIADGTGAELLQAIQLERQQQEAETKRKKKTELPPVEAGEEPYNVPENWTWTRLGGVYSLISGRDEPTHTLNSKEEGTPYIMGASNIKENGFQIEKWIAEPKVVSNIGDIIITVKGTVGKIIENQVGGMNLSRQVMALRQLSGSNLFLKYYLINSLEKIQQKISGIIPGISRDVLLELEFPLPPLAEQHRIVEKIEAIFAQLDVMEDAIRLQKDEASKCYEEILRKSLEGTPERVNEKEERELVSIGAGTGLSLSDLQNGKNEE